MAEKLIPIAPKLEKLKEKRNELRDEMSKINEGITAQYAEIDKVKAEESV
jgi:hypothetical protein